MADRRRVLLVYSNYASFVRQDHDILAERYDVATFPLEWRPSLVGRLSGHHLRLLQAMRKADLVYWWFMADYAGLGSVFARLTRTPFIAVAGGFDVTNEPGYDYGRLAVGSLKERLGTKTALKLADHVLTVSPLSDEETRMAGRETGRHLIPNGVDVERFHPTPREDRDAAPPVVVAVGAIDETNYQLKGQWVFAEASKRVPHARFLMIGPADENVVRKLRAQGGPNLEIMGPVPYDTLPRLLQEAHVICQLSRRESFGMALAEGVASGCAPVHTDEGIGVAPYLEGFGRTAPYGDVQAVANAIEEAIEAARSPDHGQRAHTLIRGNLSLDLRAERLHALLDRVL